MSGHCPPTRNSSSRSQNWPWISPQICVGVRPRQLIQRDAFSIETNGDGRVDPLDVCLLDEDLARLQTEFLDLLFGYGLAACVHNSCVSGSCASCPRREEGTHQFLSCSIWLRVGAGQGKLELLRVILARARTHRSRLDDIGTLVDGEPAS